jgi:hypothetical protein
MTVLLEEGRIVLRADCGVEEAEALLGMIDANPGLAVDLSAADRIHTALWQVILMSGCDLCGAPREGSSWKMLLPVFRNSKL